MLKAYFSVVAEAEPNLPAMADALDENVRAVVGDKPFTIETFVEIPGARYVQTNLLERARVMDAWLPERCEVKTRMDVLLYCCQ